MNHGFEQGVTELEHLHLRDGLAVLVARRADLLGQSLDTRVVLEGDFRFALLHCLGGRVGEHGVFDVLGSHTRTLLIVGCQHQHLGELLGELRGEVIDVALGDQAVGDEQLRVCLDAVDFLPQIHFSLVAIAGGVGRGVA